MRSSLPRYLANLATSLPRMLVCAFACAMAAGIAWPDRVLSHGSITTTVLFDREIVRVLNDHCVMCHMEQGLAFPLETYEQTWLRRQPIRTSVLRRHMPPWAAVTGYGTFANANSLTLRESQFVTSWVEGLGPRNAGKVFLNVANATPSTEPVRATAAHITHWRTGAGPLSATATHNRAGEAGRFDCEGHRGPRTRDCTGRSSHRVHAWRSSRAAGSGLYAGADRPVAGKLDAMVRVRHRAAGCIVSPPRQRTGRRAAPLSRQHRERHRSRNAGSVICATGIDDGRF